MNKNTPTSDYKTTILREINKVVDILSNTVFCEITNTKSVGHYQYDKYNEYFTFREQARIHELQKITMYDFLIKLERKLKELIGAEKIDIELNNNQYTLFFETSETRYQYNSYNKNLFKLFLEFYEFAKKEAIAS